MKRKRILLTEKKKAGLTAAAVLFPVVPLTVKITAESVPLRLSLTRAINPNLTKCAAISAASSRPTIDVKSHSHSSADTAVKQSR